MKRKRSDTHGGGAELHPEYRFVSFEHYYTPCSRRDEEAFSNVLDALKQTKSHMLIKLSQEDITGTDKTLDIMVLQETGGTRRRVPDWKFGSLTGYENTDVYMNDETREGAVEIVLKLAWKSLRPECYIEYLQKNRSVPSIRLPPPFVLCASLLLTRCFLRHMCPLQHCTKRCHVSLNVSDDGSRRLLEYFAAKMDAHPTKEYHGADTYELTGNLYRSLSKCRECTSDFSRLVFPQTVALPTDRASARA
jgi:hypothetical protein